MRSFISNLLTIAMVVMLVATQGAAATARGHMAQVAISMVICDGDGLRTILIGADGQDIPAAPICVECDQSIGLAGWGLVAPAAPTPAYWALWIGTRPDQAALQSATWGARPRAPPVIG